MAFEMMENGESGARLKVVGVGGGGGNVLNNMITRKVKGVVQFIAANTDRQALSNNLAETKIQLGESGLGAGGRPEVGQAAANNAREEIADQLRGANMVFITAGMGGGTGTGAAPVVAEVAQELGILTVAVVTKPFNFEGGRRMRNAQGGIDALKARVHSLIIILNDKLEQELGEDATMIECFAKADEVLYNAVAGISEIIEAPGLINADFEDVRSVMSERGTAMMGSAEAEGPDRALQAASQAISCPLLEDIDFKCARGLLVNITSGHNIKMSEIRIAMDTIRNFADPDANIVFGSVFDESLGDKVRVTVIATGLGQEGDSQSWVPPVSTKPAAPKITQTSNVWTPQGHTQEKTPAAMGVDLFGQPDPNARVNEPPKAKVAPQQPVNPFDIRSAQPAPAPQPMQPTAAPQAQPQPQVQQPAQAPVNNVAPQPPYQPAQEPAQPQMQARPASFGTQGEPKMNPLRQSTAEPQPPIQQQAYPQAAQPAQPAPFTPIFNDQQVREEPVLNPIGQQPSQQAVPPQMQPQVPPKAQSQVQPQPPRTEDPREGAHSPFGQAGAFSRPIAQPDDGLQVPPAQTDNTIFGRASSVMGFRQSGFASLNPGAGQGSGLWSNTNNVQDMAESKPRDENNPTFEHDIPAFLRKKS